MSMDKMFTFLLHQIFICAYIKRKKKIKKRARSVTDDNLSFPNTFFFPLSHINVQREKNYQNMTYAVNKQQIKFTQE